MDGLGWQELIIVLILVGIMAGVPIAIVTVAIRRARRPMLVTGDGLPTTPLFAGFWSRAGASVIDNVIVWVLSIVAFIPVASLTFLRADQPPNDMRFLLIPFLPLLLIWLAYTVIGNGRGATPGKRRAGLRVTDAAGAAPGMRRALVRAAIPLGISLLGIALVLRVGNAPSTHLPNGMTAVLWLANIAWVVDVLWMIWDPRKQALHDKLAGTFVVYA